MAVKEEKWSDLIWPRVRCSPAVQGQWPFSGEIKDSHSEAHLIICEIHIQKLIHKHHPRERSGARNISVPLTHAFLKLLRLSTFTYITNAITVCDFFFFFFFFLISCCRSRTHRHIQMWCFEMEASGTKSLLELHPHLRFLLGREKNGLEKKWKTRIED